MKGKNDISYITAIFHCMANDYQNNSNSFCYIYPFNST